MSLHSMLSSLVPPHWLRNLRCRHQRPARHSLRRRFGHSWQAPGGPVPGIESLEFRLLLSAITVTNTSDSGAGSLRQAIVDSNASVGVRDTITFNIPISDPGYNSGTGAFTIAPTSGLPFISDPAIIDGYTQTGASPNTLVVGDNAQLKIELSGAVGHAQDGLVITAGGSTVRGLAIDGFYGDGIVLETRDLNVVEGNFIGTDVTGGLGVGNGYYGVNVAGSNSNRIGTDGNGVNDFAERNVIFASQRPNTMAYYVIGAGILLNGVNQNVVAGNYIGTDASGTHGLGGSTNIGYPGQAAGVYIVGGSNNQIGSSGLGTDNVAQRNVISGNQGNGVYIGDGNLGLDRHNIVAGNYIGTNAAGTGRLIDTNSIPLTTNIGDGVFVQNSTGNVIVSNLVSGNSYFGIGVEGSQRTIVAGNRIGTDFTGTVAVGNGFAGVRDIDYGTAGGNIIGGTSAAERNVISGNGQEGVSLFSGNTVVEGNFIGTDITGTQALGNTLWGIFTGDGNTIGGTNTGAGNLLSGNKGGGIGIIGSHVSVQGNFIGTDVTGTAKLGNGPAQGIYAGLAIYGGAGVIVFNGSQSTTIGGAAPGAGNLISGNNSGGVIIGGQYSWPVAGPTNTQVQGNRIGTDATGSAALGNDGFGGIFVWNGATDSLIGGTAPGAANTIAFNVGDGVVVASSTSTGNAIRGNSIHDNTRLGINLMGGTEDTFGVTANHTGFSLGPNNLQNYPVLTSAIVSGGSTTVQGTLNSTSMTTFTLEFFTNTAGDPSGHGEGQSFLASAFVTTDGSGNVMFSITLPISISAGQAVLSATATDPIGNTSEFSANITATMIQATTTAVTSSANSSVAGQQVTFTATVTAVPGPGTPTGTVTFKDGAITLGIGTLNGSGQATFTTANLGTGSHIITAVYGGDGTFTGSTSAGLTQTVNSTTSPPVAHGQTATIGFWHNKNGQTLISSLNGGASATALGNWLATNFGNLFGAGAGSHNLTGKSNAQVASFYLTLFNVRGQKLDAQVLATAFAVFATTSSLGGTVATQYGFTVNAAGTGASTYNVGSNGAAFHVANNTTLTVMQLLQAANQQAFAGVLYNGNKILRDQANTIFDGINQAGDII